MWRITFGRNYQSGYYATTRQLPVILGELIIGLSHEEIDTFFRSADATGRYYYRAADAWIDRVCVESVVNVQ